METHPLRGVALKLNRAEDNLQSIMDTVITFIESDFYETVAEKAAAAGLAAPGLIPAVYAALKDTRTKPDFGHRPLAHAALAQRSFGA